jgi:hypothetical protein
MVSTTPQSVNTMQPGHTKVDGGTETKIRRRIQAEPRGGGVSDLDDQRRRVTY